VKGDLWAHKARDLECFSLTLCATFFRCRWEAGLNGPKEAMNATWLPKHRRKRKLHIAVSSGYSFVHQLILDYFASLDTPLTKPELPQPSQAGLLRACSACGYQEERPRARFCAGCGKSLAS
jgi:hypothetical protein